MHLPANAQGSLSSLHGRRSTTRRARPLVVRVLATEIRNSTPAVSGGATSPLLLPRSGLTGSGSLAAAHQQQQQLVQQPSGLLLPPTHAPRRPQVASSAAAPIVQTQTSQSPAASSTSAPPAARNGNGNGKPASAAGAPPQQPSFQLPSSTAILLPNGQRAHSLHDEGMRVVESMSGWADQNLMQYLKPVERSWQPQDFLPQPESPDFYDQVQALRASAANLPFDYLVVLVGDMVTEEALPSYMNMLNLLDGTKDETGAQTHPWAVWTRHWTAEENRHGNLLNKYLYLNGRVNMKSVETTIQRLVGNGLDPQLENNPYLCFVYTSFQERATKISHANTARLAAYYGDSQLAKICGVIAADEGRHEIAYTAIVSEFLRRDPEGALLAFADMMRKGIVMPAHLLDDGVHTESNKGGNLFNDYAAVADNIGVYTTNDYADIVEHLVKKWQVAEMTGLSGQAAAAQEYLMGHAGRIRRLANIQAERRLRDRKRGKTREASFDWIRGRQVALQ